VQNEDRFLHRAADKSLKILVHAVEVNPDSLPIILRGLIDSNGAYAFDRITKTKTIEKLLSKVNNENAEDVFDALTKPVLIVQR
jgi:DNA polymerase phi